MVELDTEGAARRLEVGTRVEVRKRFDASWARGFEVAGTTDHGYQLRRLSDGSVLPAEFGLDDVRVDDLRDWRGRAPTRRG